MSKKMMAMVLLGMISSFAGAGQAQAQQADIVQAVDQLQQRLGVGWILTWDKPGTRIVHIEQDLGFAIAHKGHTTLLSMPDELGGTPAETAMAFLRKHAAIFQLPLDLHDLRVHDRGPTDTHIYIYQSYNGLPVIGATLVNRGVLIYIEEKMGVERVSSNYVPNINIPITPSLSEEEAIAIAREDIVKNHLPVSKSAEHLPFADIFTEKPKTKLCVYISEPEEPVLAYWFSQRALGGRVDVEYLIDAHTGMVLHSADPRIYAYNGYGSGKAFWPNPVNTLKDSLLRDRGDNGSAVPLKAYGVQALKYLLTSGTNYILMGPYVRPDDRLEPPIYFSGINSTSYNGAVLSPSSDFSFKTNREDNRFEHVMVYHVIDSNQRYIQSLGLGDIYKKPIQVDPHGWNGDDMSSYNPIRDYLAFGEGGVDDAEDADIILHEYGHAIQVNQAPTSYRDATCHSEAGALAEGFGDYWQASNTRAISKANGFDPACYAEWDNAGKGALCRRRVDRKKRYGSNMTGDCHQDGEIWSSALWEILTKFGPAESDRKMADQLILQSNFELEQPKMLAPLTLPTFVEAGTALLKADETLNQRGIFTVDHSGIICTALKSHRSIPVPGCQ